MNIKSIPKAPTLKEWIDNLEKQKALFEENLKLINRAIQQLLQPQVVWIQEKERTEKTIKEIDKSLNSYRKYVKK